MGLSNLISKIGAMMAYYGAFGALPCLFAGKFGNVWLYLGAISACIALAIFVKKIFHISFVGPDVSGRISRSRVQGH